MISKNYFKRIKLFLLGAEKDKTIFLDFFHWGIRNKKFFLVKRKKTILKSVIKKLINTDITPMSVIFT